MKLKELLVESSENSFVIPAGIETRMLVEEMLARIGDPDLVLRDELIYTCFAHWISEGKLDHAILQHTYTQIIGDRHLVFGIGEKDTDTVFTRSFSLLVLTLLLESHRRELFLANAEIHRIKTPLCDYLVMEQDLRGYVLGKGWAHTIAHCSDALNELVQCEELGEEDLLPVLYAMLTVMGTSQVAFTHNED